jgi:hypothetical protein
MGPRNRFQGMNSASLCRLPNSDDWRKVLALCLLCDPYSTLPPPPPPSCQQLPSLPPLSPDILLWNINLEGRQKLEKPRKLLSNSLGAGEMSIIKSTPFSYSLQSNAYLATIPTWSSFLDKKRDIYKPTIHLAEGLLICVRTDGGLIDRFRESI